MKIEEIVASLGGEIREKQLKELIKMISDKYGDDDEDDQAFKKLGESLPGDEPKDKMAKDGTGEEEMPADDRVEADEDEQLSDKVRSFFQPKNEDKDKDIKLLVDKPRGKLGYGSPVPRDTMSRIEAAVKGRGRPKGNR